METNKNMVNQPQNQQPQQEEKKKKNKFVAWWLGLNKWAKVGICAGTAAVLATAITLPIVLTKKDNSNDYIELDMSGVDEQYINKNDYPKKIKKSDTSFTYKITIAPTAESGFICELKKDDTNEGIENSRYVFEKDTSELTYTVSPLNFKECIKLRLYATSLE